MVEETKNSQDATVPATLTPQWLVTVFGQTVRVSSSQLLITSTMRERMKALAEKHEVSFFPESAWADDPRQHVVVDCVIGGLMRVVNSDENLLRLMRWTHPLGLNSTTIPVWVMSQTSTAH